MKILVLVDCQNDFISGSLANKEAQDKIPNIARKINEFDGDMIYLTLDTHDSNYLGMPEGKYLPVKHCIKNTEGWNINDEVYKALCDKGTTFEYVEKPTFGSYELVKAISRFVGNGECDIEMCGFCTDICVISNALLLKTAFYNSANISVYSDCCAGVTPEKHMAALNVMESCQINIKK